MIPVPEVALYLIALLIGAQIAMGVYQELKIIALKKLLNEKQVKLNSAESEVGTLLRKINRYASGLREVHDYHTQGCN